MTYRIGVGAGFADDRMDPAGRLIADGELDALGFECLAERTIALAHAGMASGRRPGYDPKILRRLEAVLPDAARQGVSILTNAGAADPLGAARAARELADGLGLSGVEVAAVTGDDVLDRLDPDSRIVGTDQTLRDLGDRVISANAYLGADGLVAALDAGASLVVAGRVSDSAIFAAPIMHHYGWGLDDWDRMADCVLVGHLLECGGQLSGGYFADGDRKTVPGLATLGFPFADVEPDGSATYSKVSGTGGLISAATVLEQLLYEVDDPRRYLTPDVVLDMSQAAIEQVGHDTVKVSGAAQAGRPDQLKVSVGVRDGFLAVAEIVYVGRRATARARLAAEIVTERWSVVHHRDPSEVRVDYVGFNAGRAWYEPAEEPPEVVLRLAVRTFDECVARLLVEETGALYTNGPFGGGGVTSRVTETVGLVSTFIDRDAVQSRTEIVR
ncbi:MAG TPA: acyclic terpene utilization AtuA family protein [Propionibacteriaceae bacterium]|nr:acyclic terpene utilization AtuA family protein [Propionibacteriaceae bacterium]